MSRNISLALIAVSIVCGSLISQAESALIRFVRIRETAGDTRFHLAELEAFNFVTTPNNLGGGTFGGLTSSTNDLAGVVHAATTTALLEHGTVPSVTDNAIQSAAAVWSTAAGLSAPDPRFTLDLGATYQVGIVRAWPRGDGCCTDRWASLVVEGFADNGFGSPGELIESITIGTPGGNIPQQVSFDFTVPEPASALLLGMGLVGMSLRRNRKRCAA